MSTTNQPQWLAVCEAKDIGNFLGVRALLNKQQIAIFNVNNEFFALDAIDPFSNAAVLSRGIVGDLKGHLVVASPVYKQHFNLRTGECLEDTTVKLATYSVREHNGIIELAV
ncbi:MAG: nitrite reductase small subunit [Pseudomonadota bacterium]|jgi:nitrite reductase (NADH) small subunit